MIKAVFFDVDGTLVSFNTHQITESTKKALIRLRELDIKCFVSTGRAARGVEFLRDLFDFKFDGYITMNGQYCFCGDELIYENAISPDSIRAVISYIEANHIACEFIEEDRVYINFINEKVITLRESLGGTAERGKETDVNRALHNKVYQLCPYVDEQEEKELIKQVPGCKSVRWHPLFADFIPIDGGKPVGVDKMLERFDIHPDETMAFGDGGNDIEMLKHVNIGIAMGNAIKEVRECADYITDDADHDGIYNALNKFIEKFSQ